MVSLSIHSRKGLSLAKPRRSSSFERMRPCSRSTSIISPGPRQPAVSTFAGSMSMVPTSLESRKRSSRVT